MQSVISWRVFDGEIKSLLGNRPTGKHVGCVLHVIQMGESCVVGDAFEMSTPNTLAANVVELTQLHIILLSLLNSALDLS